MAERSSVGVLWSLVVVNVVLVGPARGGEGPSVPEMIAGGVQNLVAWATVADRNGDGIAAEYVWTWRREATDPQDDRAVTALVAEALVLAPGLEGRIDVVHGATKFLVDSYRDPASPGSFAYDCRSAIKDWPFFSLRYFVRLKKLGHLDPGGLLFDEVSEAGRPSIAEIEAAARALIEGMTDCFAASIHQGYPHYTVGEAYDVDSGETIADYCCSRPVQEECQNPPCAVLEGCQWQDADVVMQTTFKTAPCVVALFEAHQAGYDVDREKVALALASLAAARMPGEIFPPGTDPSTVVYEGSFPGRRPDPGAVTYTDGRLHHKNMFRCLFSTLPGSISRLPFVETALGVWNGVDFPAGTNLRPDLPAAAGRMKRAVDAFFFARARATLDGVAGDEHLLSELLRYQKDRTYHDPHIYSIAPYYFFTGVLGVAVAIEYLDVNPEDRRMYREKLAEFLSASRGQNFDQMTGTPLDPPPPDLLYWQLSSATFNANGMSRPHCTALALLSLLAPEAGLTSASMVSQTLVAEFAAAEPDLVSYKRYLGVDAGGEPIPVYGEGQTPHPDQILFARELCTRSVLRGLHEADSGITSFHDISYERLREAFTQIGSGADASFVLEAEEDHEFSWDAGDESANRCGYDCGDYMVCQVIQDSCRMCQPAGDTTYRNVVATQVGTDPELAADVILVSAHYDSSCAAPGAIDNASGVAAVLELARVLARYPSKRTVKYVLFDAEEVGRRGSMAFVDAGHADDVRLAVNLDMIGHYEEEATVTIITQTSSMLAHRVAAAFDTYGGGLTWELILNDVSGTYVSDHMSFEEAGVPAVVVTQKPNAWWDGHVKHTPGEYLGAADNEINYDMVGGILRSLIGFLAVEAGTYIPGDLNHDARIDWEDYRIFEICYHDQTHYCAAGDFDRDGDIDDADWQAFFAAWTDRVATVPPITQCWGGADCNMNGIPDACECRYGFAADADMDDVPDICETSPLFMRGDSNADGTFDIADAITTLVYLFRQGSVSCLEACDSNDNGQIEIGDPIFLLNYLFNGCTPPPPPFVGCGLDPTADQLDSCDSYPPCTGP